MSESARERAVDPGAGAHGGRIRRRNVLRLLAAGVSGAALTGAAGYAAAEGGLLNGLIRDQVYPRGPAFLQLDWSKADSNIDTSNWAHFNGDPNADPDDMRKWPVGFVSIEREPFDEELRKLGGQEAIKFRTESGHTKIGKVPDGSSFLASPRKDGNTSRLVVGASIGNEDVRFMPGIWVEKEDRFVVPAVGAIALPMLVRPWDVMAEMPGVRNI
jgi:hypothetical protein